MKGNIANDQCPMVHFAPESLVSENILESKSGGLYKNISLKQSNRNKEISKSDVWMFILLDTVSSFL